jgi:hypothetical protein
VREIAALGGLTARAGDPLDLARQVTRAWRDIDAFGTPRDLRARVEARYSWSTVIDRWLAVYARALSEPRRASRAVEGSPSGARGGVG